MAGGAGGDGSLPAQNPGQTAGLWARGWPAVHAVSDGLRRWQGIKRPIVGHIYGSASGSVSSAGGAVRLRASAPDVRKRRPSGRLDGGGDEVAVQVRRHLLTSPALSLAHIVPAGHWMQRRALNLLSTWPLVRRLSSGRAWAGHAASPAQRLSSGVGTWQLLALRGPR